MDEIANNYGFVTTLRILVEQDRKQLEAMLGQHAGMRKPMLIVPLLASEYTLPENLPVFENTLINLSQAKFLHKIIFGLDQASKSEMQFLQELIAKHQIQTALIQWNDGPACSGIYQMLNEAGMVASAPGKGKNCFLGIGIALALNAKVVGILEADIRSFDCTQLDRLFYPLMVHDYDFAKACYHRISRRKLYGRVKRLLVDPLLIALKVKFIASNDVKMLGLIDFLLQFKYPLAGEVAFRADLLKKMRFVTNWGVEIFTLVEIYRKASRVAQVDFSVEPFDHKHQPVSEEDWSKGLARMAVDIVRTLMDVLVKDEKLDLSETFSRDLLAIYMGIANKLTAMYADESRFNGLDYDWHYEQHLARDVFGDCILHVASALNDKIFETPRTASWERIFHEIPRTQDLLLKAVGMRNLPC